MNLTIDGRDVSAGPGTTILHAARAAGIDIPTLCQDDRLEPIGACRLCRVQIEGRPATTAWWGICRCHIDHRPSQVAVAVVRQALTAPQAVPWRPAQSHRHVRCFRTAAMVSLARCWSSPTRPGWPLG